MPGGLAALSYSVRHRQEVCRAIAQAWAAKPDHTLGQLLIEMANHAGLQAADPLIKLGVTGDHELLRALGKIRRSW